MTDFTNMSKKQLLALDAAKAIKGRHEMTKDQLVIALTATDLADQDDQAAPVDPTPTVKLDWELQHPAIDDGEDDADAPVPALTPRRSSGNVPYKHKYYYLDVETYRSLADEVAKAPNQVQLILKTMLQCEFVGYDNAEIGKTIVDAGKKAGILRTTIGSAQLFAYYRRRLEQLGVVHAA